MKPKSTRMFVSRSFLTSTIVLLLIAPPAAAVDHLGGHFRDPAEFSRIIDQRCTRCHTRERIEAAMKRQEALEPLTRRMIERGAVVSEQEKEVLGTFWGTPLKRKNENK